MNLEHKKRWITAMVGLVILFGTYFLLGHWGLVILTVAVSVAAYLEFLSFSGAFRNFRWLSAISCLVLSTWLCLELPGASLALYLACLGILLRTLWQVHISSPEEINPNFIFAETRVFGLVYTIFFPSFLPKVHAMAHGPTLLLFLLLVIWVGDTAGYYGGKLLGKRKLSPNVSPGKTLEGAVATLLACAVMALIFRQFSLMHMAPWKLAAIAIFSSLVAQAGDLLESLMKRAYRVKDSGGLFPGHGGVFDRFDGLILAAPFFYFLMRLAT